uniref:Uncharacterized protein n=1 Tax=Leersia perrieri TaxID=77586 RepID=A0A0D9WQ47_9ORYZ
MTSDLTRPILLYNDHYPYSGVAVERAVRRSPAAEDGAGSFGPVLVVLAVISFLAVSACVYGRLCGGGRRPPSKGDQQQQRDGAAHSSDAEKGFGVVQQQQQQAVTMRPVPSSRATVHDVDDDVFEIKLTAAPSKPPAAGGGGRAPTRPMTVPIGVPRQCVPAAAGFRRAPPATASGGAAVRQGHAQVVGRGNGGAAFVHG